MSYEKELFRLEQPHGPGEIQFAWQKGSGAYVATTGADCCISIYNRHGRFVQKMRLPGLCLSLDWDSDGDLLGAICTNSSVVSLWDANTGKKCTIETGLIRDTLSCLLWAKNAPILAITTTKGNIVIYNHNTAKRIPILGKHTKSITSGGWSSEGLLALGSDDRTLSISNVDGDSLRVIQLRAEPNQIQFSEMKTDERAAKENTVSVVVGKKTLFLYNLQDPENPIELAFQPRYGNIVIYKWFGDGYILIGFSAGYFVAISTHIREVGQELFQAKNHRDTFSDIAISHLLGKVASCGDNTVKVHEMGQLSESPAVISVDDESGGVERIAYSEDGQLLGVGTASGSLRVYLTRLPMLAAAYNNTIALLTALTQLTIHQLQLSLHKGKMSPCSVSLEMEVEPSFLALGPYHMVGGMNNRAWLYELNRTFPSPSPDDNIMSGDYSPTTTALIVPQFVSDREYLGSVQSIRLNAEYTSALFEGKLLLHLTECSGGTSANNEERESKLFPEEGEHLSITCHALTSDFLVYASDMGHLRYFYLDDWVQVTDYRHSVGIKEIFTDHVGTRLIVFDDKSEGYLYNPVSDTMLVIPGFPSTATGAIWDLYHPERNVFIVFDSQIIVTYLHIRDSIDGPSVSKVGETKLPLDQKPLVLHAGEVTLETSGGKLVTLLLSTHQMPTPTTNLNQTQCFQMALDKRIALHRFQEAWNTCVSLDQKESWDKLIDCALHNLQIDTSIRLYRQIGEAGMVWSLQRIQDIEDKKLLSGHVSMFLQDFDKAQELFLESSEPVQALVMRQDIMQWDQALQLARSLDPSRIPYLSREYANQLELIGQYTEALAHYERGLSEEVIREDDHNALCRAGIARTAIRCGDYRRGIAMATDPRADVQLKQECAEILESMKKLNDAAILFEKAENFDRAASAYISLKNWQKVGELLPKVTSTKIHQQYAKVKESMGEYRVARQAYQLAGDLDSVVRLDLEHLNDPQEAVRIVQQTRSIDGAKSVAKFFQRIGDYSSAIRFLVMSRCHSDAFRLSRDHNQLELYGDILVEESMDGEAEQEFLSLAVHFEQSQGKYFLAGKYYYHARDYKKAMKYLLMAARSNRDEEGNEEANAIGLAIEVVGASNDDVLANQLIELLLGETDGEPRDPKYVFRLYMARRQYREAAKTAIIIAKEEQINGNYRSAHDVLLGMCQELRENHLRIGTEMMDNLTLLHSYILVRLHVRLGNHLNAARMLIRVADNISKFPSHIVPILTSAVIECHRADLKATAFTYAAMLMRPEYRSQVEPKYRKKMEGVVRKPPRGANNKLLPDEPEPLTPCPYCGYRLPETQLHCTQCKSNVPFCIATGRHILKDDLTVCTNCHFPAIKTELLLLLESGDNNCPMCCERLDPHQLKSIHDLSIYLQPSSSDD